MFDPIRDVLSGCVSLLLGQAKEADVRSARGVDGGEQAIRCA